MSMFSAATVAVSLVLSYCLLQFISRLRAGLNRLPFPPGPKPKFLIGNVFDFPDIEPGPVFNDWGKKYKSDLVFATALGTDVVIINSRAVAHELFEKRANLYNDRPWIPAASLCGWDFNFGFLGYGDIWRRHRKVAQQHFNRTAARRYQPVQRDRIHHFLRGVLNEPDKIRDHNRMLSISVSLLTMYGYEPMTLEEPVIHLAEENIHISTPILGPSTLMNVIPILRHIPHWVPGATSQRVAKRARDISAKVKAMPTAYTANAMRNGTATPSFMTSFLEKKATEGASDEEHEVVSNVAWTTYAAGSDTIITAALAFMHTILIHPEVQKKAQAELDRVVGNDRLPDFNDRPSLPYIEAIYREVMRYRPIVGAGIPHALTEDDVYDGYLLPKGATVIGNIWAMTHDERVYSEPYKFMPERFFTADGKLNDDSRILAFGFGRRVCVGQHMASSLMFMLIASFLACFDIKPAKDEFGNEIEVNNEYEDIFILAVKKPFKCSITPRSEQIRKIIEATGNK